MKIFKKIKNFFNKLYSNITLEIKYRKRLKELRKRDPFIYD